MRAVPSADDLVVPVGRVGGHRPDLGRFSHRHRLVGVEQVRVLGDDLAVEQDLLEHHDVGARQPGRVEREVDLDGAVGRDGLERLLGSDLLAADRQGVARRLVHEPAAGHQLLEGEVRVAHLVDDDGAPVGGERVVAVRLVERDRVDPRLGDVVHGAEVDVEGGVGGVAAHVERVRPQRVALVRLAAQLLDGVLAVGQGP